MTVPRFSINLLKNYYHNRKGWKTKRKLVVFQSDDWGSIRMPSHAALEGLRDLQVQVDKCHYMRLDTVASEEDLNALFRVLEKHRDSKGKHPVFTANFLTRNPDFNSIRESEFKDYSSIVIDRLKSAKESDRPLKDLWVEGYQKGLFYPQLHGREHLNIERWLKALQEGHSILRYAFDHGFWGISKHTSSEMKASLQAALDFDDSGYSSSHIEIIREACEDFEKLFGFSSHSFIAPNYVWSSSLEPHLKRFKVKYLQSGPVQVMPQGGGKYQYQKRFTGDMNSEGQIYLVRNVHFEPSESLSKDWIKSTFDQIRMSFFMNRPAIINTHRLNYIGGLEPANRERSLHLLDELLGVIMNSWPQVEYLNTVELGDLITQEKAS